MTWVLSTRWSKARAGDGDALIGLLIERRPEGIEIAAGLPGVDLRQAMEAARRARAAVISVCVPAPCPRLLAGERPPEALDPDAGIRAAFLGLARRTIEVAHELESRFVVLALTSALRREQDETVAEALPVARAVDERERAIVRAASAWRARRSIRDLDSAKRVIEGLLDAAQEYGIRLAFPLRSGLLGFPSATEAAEILREFRGAPVGIWFDAVSAGLIERLGENDREILDTFEERIEGTRIHDLRGWTRHLPPGEGELDRELEATVLSRFHRKPCVLDISGEWDETALDGARHRIESIALDRRPPGLYAG